MIRGVLTLTFLDGSLKILSYSKGSHPESIDRDPELVGKLLPAIYLRTLLFVVVPQNQFAVLGG